MSETMQASSTGKAAELAAAAQKAYAQAMAIGFEQVRLNYEQAQQAHASELQALYTELNERSQQAWRAFNEALGAAYSAAPAIRLVWTSTAATWSICSSCFPAAMPPSASRLPTTSSWPSWLPIHSKVATPRPP